MHFTTSGLQSWAWHTAGLPLHTGCCWKKGCIPAARIKINPEYSLEGLLLKLMLQYFGYLMRKLTGKDPDAGKDWGQEEKGVTENETVGWIHWLNRHESEQARGDWKTGKPGVLQSMESQWVGHDWATTTLLTMKRILDQEKKKRATTSSLNSTV